MQPIKDNPIKWTAQRLFQLFEKVVYDPLSNEPPDYGEYFSHE